VFPPHQVTDLAFDLGSGGPVVGDPGRVGLVGVGQGVLVWADADGATGRGGGALLAQRAPGAGRPEVGGATTVCGRADRRGEPAGTADRARVEVDLEAVLAEPPAGRGRCLGLALRLDPALLQPVMELAGAVGVVPVDRGRCFTSGLASGLVGDLGVVLSRAGRVARLVGASRELVVGGGRLARVVGSGSVER